ncbi:MAG: hypothetical protein HFE85_02105 [Clostridiales bacterium]|nr:hypothetical protein [Clostridiales bacterium]
MAEQGLLKKSLFGGFKKDDVLEYIDKLNENARQEESRLTRRLDEIEEKNVFLSQQALQLKQLLEDTQRQLEEQNQRVQSLTESKKSLDAELLSSRYSDEQHIRELEFEREKNRQMELALEALEEKAKSYDGLSAQIGDIMVEARLQSARLMQETHDQCSEMTGHANDSVETMAARIDQLSSQMSGIREQFEQSMQAMSSEMDSIGKQLTEKAAELREEKITLETAQAAEEEEIVRAAEEDRSSLFSKAAEAQG